MYSLGLIAQVDRAGTSEPNGAVLLPRGYPTESGGLEPVAGPEPFAEPGLLPIAPPSPGRVGDVPVPSVVPIGVFPTGEAVEFGGPTHVEFVRDVLPAGLQPGAQADVGLIVGLAFVGALVFAMLRGGRV